MSKGRFWSTFTGSLVGTLMGFILAQRYREEIIDGAGLILIIGFSFLEDAEPAPKPSPESKLSHWPSREVLAELEKTTNADEFMAVVGRHPEIKLDVWEALLLTLPLDYWEEVMRRWTDQPLLASLLSANTKPRSWQGWMVGFPSE